MKSSKEPSFESQAPLATSTPVDHNSTTFDATIAVLIEFSTSITQTSSQLLITPTVTSTKDDIPAVSVVPLLIAWQVMRETSTVSSLSNKLLQRTKMLSVTD
jgi:hypothetical protein